MRVSVPKGVRRADDSPASAYSPKGSPRQPLLHLYGAKAGIKDYSILFVGPRSDRGAGIAPSQLDPHGLDRRGRSPEGCCYIISRHGHVVHYVANFRIRPRVALIAHGRDYTPNRS